MAEPVGSWQPQDGPGGWSADTLAWTQGAWQAPSVALSGPRFGVHFAGVLLFSILLGLTWVLHIEANGPGGPVSRLLAMDESNLAATMDGAPAPVPAPAPAPAPPVPVPVAPEPGVVVAPALPAPAPAGPGGDGGSGAYVSGGVPARGGATVVEERTTVERGGTVGGGPQVPIGERDVGVPTLANPDSNPTLGPSP